MNNEMNNDTNSSVPTPEVTPVNVVPVVETVIEEITVAPTETMEQMVPETSLTQETVVEAVVSPVQTMEEIVELSAAPVEVEVIENVEPIITPTVMPIAEPVVTVAQEPVVPPVVLATTIVEPAVASLLPEKKKIKKPVIIAAIITLVILVCLGAYYFYSRSEKVILGNSIKLLENFKNYIETPFTLKETGEYSQSGNISVKTNGGTEADSINGFLNNMSFTYGISKNSENTLFNLGLTKEEKLLAGIKLYSTKETGYIFLDKIFDKYIEMEELKDALTSTNYNDKEDYEYLYTFVMNSLASNIDSKDLTKDKAEIEIDGKKKAVNSLKLKYNDKEIIALLGLIVDDIRSDKKANEIITAAYAEFKDLDVKDSLASVDEEHMSTYIYTVYTSIFTNGVEGIDFDYSYFEESYNYDACDIYEDDSELDNMNSTEVNSVIEDLEFDEEYTVEGDDPSIYDYDYEFDYDYDYGYDDCMTIDYTERKGSIEYRNDSDPKIYVKEDGKLLGFIELVKENDVLTVNFYETKDKKLGYAKITSNSKVFNVEVSFLNEEEEFKFELLTDIKEVTKGAEYNLDTTATFSSYVNKEKDQEITFKMTSNIKNSASIKENVTGSVKYEELTDLQTEEILTNLMNIMSEAGLQ